MPFQNPILWIHEEAPPRNPARLAWQNAPALFVLTRSDRSAGISRKRLGFLYECALDCSATLRKGDVAAEVIRFAERHQADGIVTSIPVDPRLERIAAQVESQYPLERLEPEPLVNLPRPPRL